MQYAARPKQTPSGLTGACPPAPSFVPHRPGPRHGTRVPCIRGAFAMMLAYCAVHVIVQYQSRRERHCMRLLPCPAAAPHVQVLHSSTAETAFCPSCAANLSCRPCHAADLSCAALPPAPHTMRFSQLQQPPSPCCDLRFCLGQQHPKELAVQRVVLCPVGVGDNACLFHVVQDVAEVEQVLQD